MEEDTGRRDVMAYGTESESDAEDEVTAAARNWREALAEKDTGGSKSSKWFWFILTMILFVSIRGTENILTTITGLIPVLLFHELGHVLAMKLCGYTEVGIFFIPLLFTSNCNFKDNILNIIIGYLFINI